MIDHMTGPRIESNAGRNDAPPRRMGIRTGLTHGVAVFVSFLVLLCGFSLNTRCVLEGDDGSISSIELSPTMLFIILGSAVVWFILAAWTYNDARMKGIKARSWFLLVLIFNIFGLVVYLVYAAGKRRPYTDASWDTIPLARHLPRDPRQYRRRSEHQVRHHRPRGRQAPRSPTLRPYPGPGASVERSRVVDRAVEMEGSTGENADGHPGGSDEWEVGDQAIDTGESVGGRGADGNRGDWERVDDDDDDPGSEEEEREGVDDDDDHETDKEESGGNGNEPAGEGGNGGKTLTGKKAEESEETKEMVREFAELEVVPHGSGHEQ